MSRVKVKICGVRSLLAAKAAIKGGADFVGLNFIPTSKRKIDPELAKDIRQIAKGRVLVVGIFQDQPIEQVNSLISKLGLDLVQLHGVEDEDYMQQVKVPIVKSFTIAPDDDLQVLALKLNSSKAQYILVDRLSQGEGEAVALGSLSKLIPHLQKKLFLAGGLVPENVATKVEQLKPFVVDVAGGIETNGEQNVMKIQQFIYEAKGGREK